MKIGFKDIIGKESNKNAIVLGLGPSLNKHLDAIKKLKQDRANNVIISCNKVDKLAKLVPDYWVLANSEFTIKNSHARLNKAGVVVYADSVDLTSRSEADRVLKTKYLPYDQRHFGGKKCGQGKCCKHAIPGRLTIQEECKKYTKYDKLDTSCDTVAIPMLYLSVLLGCKNIYVTGVDLNYSGGYVNGHKAYAPNKKNDPLVTCQSRILKTMEIIKDSAQNIETNIYCIDKDLPISKVFKYSELPKGK